MIGAAAVGLIVGMIIELMIDAGTVRDLQDHNRKLKFENEQIRHEFIKKTKTEPSVPIETIEIIDLPQPDKTYHQPF